MENFKTFGNKNVYAKVHADNVKFRITVGDIAVIKLFDVNFGCFFLHCNLMFKFGLTKHVFVQTVVAVMLLSSTRYEMSVE